MWPIYGAAIQRAIGDRLNDEEAGILAASWASSIRAGTMTADHRFVLLVRIKNVRPATNAPNRKAAAAMTEASF
jgi:hypothetical protein